MQRAVLRSVVARAAHLPDLHLEHSASLNLKTEGAGVWRGQVRVTLCLHSGSSARNFAPGSGASSWPDAMTQCLVIRYHPGWSPGSHTGRVGGARLPAAGAACNGKRRRWHCGGRLPCRRRAATAEPPRGADTCFGGSALTALGRAASASAPSGLLAVARGRSACALPLFRRFLGGRL